MTRPVIHALSIIALVGCSIVGALCLSDRVGRRDRIPDRSFVADLWRNGDRRSRGAMVHDLEIHGRLLGMTKPAVLALLGPPDASDTTGYAFDYAVDLGLRTGPWGLGGTWLFFITVHFDTAEMRAVEVSTRD